MSAPGLPAVFLGAPIAHRALHGPGRPENSRAAVAAAMSAGYAIELDVQMTSDGAAVVFHDEDLLRMTGTPGMVSERTVADVIALPLLGGQGRIPSLSDILAQVEGRVPILIEIKSDAGRRRSDDRRLEEAVARDVSRYHGPVAVMSFDPSSIAAMADAAPAIPRGLTTMVWPADAENAHALTSIASYDRIGACFVSHRAADLGHSRIAALRDAGAAILCWTIRDPAQEAIARRVAHNITFEGYAPTIPDAP